MQLLANTLYSNKIAAVLREIGCNALDANVEAGHPNRPIRVHLPSQHNLHFYIEDDGPGMSHDFIMHSFNAYGCSTKRQDNTNSGIAANEYIGGFGLGGKTPYAYTDQFTIDSVHKGEHRTYACFVGPKGDFLTNAVGCRPATKEWPSGVRITLPVAERDVNDFLQEAGRTFRWFRTKPKFLNISNVTFAPLAFQGKHFAIQPSSELYYQIGNTRINVHSDHMFIRMGDVAYPIAPNQTAKLVQKYKELKRPTDSKTLIETAISLLDCSGLILNVPIGAIDITISREAPEFTARTYKTLIQTLEQAAVEARELILSTYNENTLTWKNLGTIKKNITTDHTWNELIRRTLKYSHTNGDLLAHAMFYPELPASKIRRALVDLDGMINVSSFRLEETIGLDGHKQQKCRASSVLNGGAHGLYLTSRLLANKNKTVIILNEGKNVIQRCRKAIDDGLYDQILLVYPVYPTFDMDNTTVKERRAEKETCLKQTKALIPTITARLLQIPVIKAEDLPGQTSSRTTSGKRVTTNSVTRKMKLPRCGVLCWDSRTGNASPQDRATNIGQYIRAEIDDWIRTAQTYDMPFDADEALKEIISNTWTHATRATVNGNRFNWGTKYPLQLGYPSFNYHDAIRTQSAIHQINQSLPDEEQFHFRLMIVSNQHDDTYNIIKRFNLNTKLAEELNAWITPQLTKWQVEAPPDTSPYKFRDSLPERLTRWPADATDLMAHATSNTELWQTLQRNPKFEPLITNNDKTLQKLKQILDEIGDEPCPDTTDKKYKYSCPAQDHNLNTLLQAITPSDQQAPAINQTHESSINSTIRRLQEDLEDSEFCYRPPSHQYYFKDWYKLLTLYDIDFSLKIIAQMKGLTS